METVTEDFQNFSQRFSGADFCCRQTTASCTFVCRKVFRHTKGARSARPGGVPESRHLTTYDMTSSKKRIGRPTTTDPRVHRYNFKLTTEENIRFKQMLCKAGLEHNRSRFIVKRIFAEEFRVVRIDPTLGRYVTRLNQFYEQIQRVGNNYNQIVRAVNTHFSHTAIPRQVLLLERRTRELKALSEQVIALSRELYELWSRG